MDFGQVVEQYHAAADILEIERWRAKVSGRTGVDSFELRVTSTFRREDGTWKLVHRHADPIAQFHPDGPMRGTTAELKTFSSSACRS